MQLQWSAVQHADPASPPSGLLPWLGLPIKVVKAVWSNQWEISESSAWGGEGAVAGGGAVPVRGLQPSRPHSCSARYTWRPREQDADPVAGRAAGAGVRGAGAPPRRHAGPPRPLLPRRGRAPRCRPRTLRLSARLAGVPRPAAGGHRKSCQGLILFYLVKWISASTAESIQNKYRSVQEFRSSSKLIRNIWSNFI